MFRKLLVCALLLSCSAVVHGQNIITTVAGGGPNNISALQAGIGFPSSVFNDSSGNLYIADFGVYSGVFKVDATGTLTRIAGNGGAGFSGDGGPATFSHLSLPSGVSVDQQANVYIADFGNNRVRKITASTGIIQTIAGNGTQGFAGDGGQATSAELSLPTGVSVDGSGNIYILDAGNNRVRKVTAASGIIQTVAGNGTAGFAGDGGPATSAELNLSTVSGTTTTTLFAGVSVDGAGNIFIADSGNCRIREVLAATGIIQTVAGNGTCAFGGDGGPATGAAAEINFPAGVFVDSHGNIFIADDGNSRVREVVAATGSIQTVAGNGTTGFAGDGGPATSASLYDPLGVFVDSAGNIFIADYVNQRIREVVAATGDIQTVAGNGTTYFNGDGIPATSAEMAQPAGVFVDGTGNVFIADPENVRIREVVATTGNIETVAGNGFAGTSGVTTTNSANFPVGVFVDASGNVFFSDEGSNLIREVVAGTENVVTVAGNGTAGYSGDGGPATSAELSFPVGIVVDASGNIFFSDSSNARVREVVKATGIIQTVAGDGTVGFSGDGGPATSAELFDPTGLYVDQSGNIFISDLGNCRVREVLATTKNIQTVAGNGTCSFGGDGGPATGAGLLPGGIYVDRTGNIFVSDPLNNRIREVSASTGNIQTVVGNGTFGFAGDGGPATSAEIALGFVYAPGVWGDQNSNLYISDPANGRIRKVTGLVAGPPANIAATSGTPQSAVISTAFQSPLAATVTDAFGNAVAGVTVTFTAPTSGATGTFVDGVSTSTATTNAAGVATSTAFTANGTLGSYMVTATAAGVTGSAVFSLTNASTLAITTATLPPATVGTAYSSTLQATGGVPPYTWSISAGTLPGGLTLNSSTGTITGTPSSGGISTFTVNVTDSETPAASQSAGLSLTVSGNLGTLIALPQPNTVGVGASVQFFAQDASGNTIPATWSVSPATGAGTISSTGLYQAPAPGSTSQTVTVTATAIADSTKQKSVSFTLAPNGLSACCQLPQQLTVSPGATSNPTGLQLNGTPVSTASTVPFALSCVGLPAGAGCIFSLPNSSTTIQTISGTSPAAFCYVFTTGSVGARTGMISRFSPKRPPFSIPPFYGIVILCIGVFALLLRIWMGDPADKSRGLAFATVAIVCISVGLLGACNGFSKANVAPPTAQVTPAGTYHIQILATPPPGSGFVQNQLIVPLTVTAP